MRRSTQVLAATTALALSTALAACGSSGGGKGSSTTPSGTTGSTGSSSANAGTAATYPKLTGTSTVLALSPAFVSALTTLKLSPTAVAPATLTTGTITFPVTGGSVAVSAAGKATGTIDHGGGIKLAAQSMNVELRDFVLTLGTTSTLSGEVLLNGASVAKNEKMFDVDTSTLRAATTSGTTTLTGAAVYVDPQAADALNAAFGLTGAKAIPTGNEKLQVGTATITLKG